MQPLFFPNECCPSSQLKPNQGCQAGEQSWLDRRDVAKVTRGGLDSSCLHTACHRPSSSGTCCLSISNLWWREQPVSLENCQKEKEMESNSSSKPQYPLYTSHTCIAFKNIHLETPDLTFNFEREGQLLNTAQRTWVHWAVSTAGYISGKWARPAFCLTEAETLGFH